ncbi:hypothetical protein LINPERPRIM_LOCUS37939 [Linum perenne]
MGSTIEDVVALTNAALSISIAQKKSMVDTNIIQYALHSQTWQFRAKVGSVPNHVILFYQIGRAVAQNQFISNSPIDPISSYIKKNLCEAEESYMYQFYCELGMSSQKLMILLLPKRNIKRLSALINLFSTPQEEYKMFISVD